MDRASKFIPSCIFSYGSYICSIQQNFSIQCSRLLMNFTKQFIGLEKNIILNTFARVGAYVCTWLFFSGMSNIHNTCIMSLLLLLLLKRSKDIVVPYLEFRYIEHISCWDKPTSVVWCLLHVCGKSCDPETIHWHTSTLPSNCHNISKSITIIPDGSKKHMSQLLLTKYNKCMVSRNHV